MRDPLRYEITDWHQLSDCLSNNSEDLYIRVSDIIKTGVLEGLRIRVCHKTFGDLFVCVLNAHGSIITYDGESENPEFTTTQILEELYKYGFIISFAQSENLPQSQLDFLASLRGLDYDKLRILRVWHYENTVAVSKAYVVVFKISENPEWINNAYSPSQQEYNTALQNGSVVNISASSQTHAWNWSWLDFVANIDDILNENHYGGD